MRTIARQELRIDRKVEMREKYELSQITDHLVFPSKELRVHMQILQRI